MEDTPDGRPDVSYGKWRFVGIFHEVADELFGVVSRAASGFQDEGNKVDVWDRHRHRHRHSQVRTVQSEMCTLLTGLTKQN